VKLQHHNRKNSLTEDKVAEKGEEMPLYPQSILKKPQEFPPVPFSLDLTEKVIEDDNESLDIVLPNRDLNDFDNFDQPTTKPGMKIFLLALFCLLRQGLLLSGQEGAQVEYHTQA
jgi:hypothetical protein